MTITFAPNGTARCLYAEEIDLHLLGRLSMRRASEIKYCATTQTWVVWSIEGKELYANKSRAKCLAWEQQHLNP